MLENLIDDGRGQIKVDYHRQSVQKEAENSETTQAEKFPSGSAEINIDKNKNFKGTARKTSLSLPEFSGLRICWVES